MNAAERLAAAIRTEHVLAELRESAELDYPEDATLIALAKEAHMTARKIVRHLHQEIATTGGVT